MNLQEMLVAHKELTEKIISLRQEVLRKEHNIELFSFFLDTDGNVHYIIYIDMDIYYPDRNFHDLTKDVLTVRSLTKGKNNAFSIRCSWFWVSQIKEKIEPSVIMKKEAEKAYEIYKKRWAS